MWKYNGRQRPDFAIDPGPGQESVWDYPRPPKLVMDNRRVDVRYADQLIASTNRCYRVLETASPPTFYLPPTEIRWELLREAPGRSVCEWKGAAKYWTYAADPSAGAIGWSYPAPARAFQSLRDYVAFYPSLAACYVTGERVRPQPGQFYGGWVTDEIVGPFKGETGTGHW